MSPAPVPARPGGEFFLQPDNSNQRRYEALRAYLLEGLSLQEAAVRFGYSVNTVASLLRDFRAGHLEFFTLPQPGPKSGPTPDRRLPMG